MSLIESSLGGTVKLLKKFFVLIITKNFEWLFSNQLWQIIGNYVFKAFLNQQELLEDYKQAIKLLVIYLFFLVQRLYQD